VANETYSDAANDVLDREWRHLKETRGYTDDNQRFKLSGLALSGGGIRSASFALGVMQSLFKSGDLQKMDYLSTVSGGGYIGSSLTWFLFRRRETDNTSPDLDQSNFPFGRRGEGARVGKPEARANAILDFIRQHGDYLTPGRCATLGSLLAVVLRSMILAFLVYFSLLVFIIIHLKKASLFEPWLDADALGAEPGFWLGTLSSLDLNALTLLAALLAVLFVVVAVLYSLATFFGRRAAAWRLPLSKSRYGARWTIQCLLGSLLAAIIVLLVLASLPVAHAALQKLAREAAAGTAGAMTILGAVGGFLRFLLERGSQGSREGLLAKNLAWVAAILVIYGVLLLAFSVMRWLDLSSTYALILLAFSVVSGTFVNLNYISLHRMYRDRLMETFLPNLAVARGGRWGLATEADRTQLEKLCGGDSAGRFPGPYHLINTNVILINSEQSSFRGRGGDNFILSPLWCGSDATGWRRTNQYMKRGASGGMTLGTAMAISGAAVNSHAGVAGKGPTRNRMVSFLLAFLNLRLGYWARNPDPARGLVALPPNYFVPGLRGLRGRGFTEAKSFVELSDGGHFENLGLYELIRRRCKFIVVSDAGQDRDFAFGDLGNAVERARVDFGAVIRFPDDPTDLANLLPGSAGDSLYVRKYGLAKHGFAIGKIYYADDKNDTGPKEGTLIYIKSTLIKGLPADVYGYKSANPRFPDQSTADQFFDEEQFEAYRELGYRLTDQALGVYRAPPAAG
jgi:hypothetical protein